MKHPEWYNDIWRKKLNELPVNDDPLLGWQQMQRMLDEAQPAGDGLTQPGTPGRNLFKIIGGIVTMALLTAIIAYKMLHKPVVNNAGNSTSVKIKNKPGAGNSPANQQAHARFNNIPPDGVKNKADLQEQAGISDISNKAAKGDSTGLNQADMAVSDTSGGGHVISNQMESGAGTETGIVAADQLKKKLNGSNGYRREKGRSSSGTATVLHSPQVAGSAKLGRIKNNAAATCYADKSDQVKGNPDRTVIAVTQNRVNIKSGLRSLSYNPKDRKAATGWSVSSGKVNAAKDKTTWLAFSQGRDTTALSVSAATDKKILAEEAGYDALLKQNSAQALMAILRQGSKIKAVTGGENGGGYSKIDMPGRSITNSYASATGGDKGGSVKFPKARKQAGLNTPRYNYGAYLGVSNGSTNTSADIGIFATYAVNQRWLINAGVHLNTLRSFSGTYSHPSFYRPDSLPSFTINDFRKAIAIDIPVKVEYRVINLLSIKAGPVLSFTGSPQTGNTTYGTIIDRRDTLKHGTELKTALKSTTISKITPGFEAGLSFHLWKLDIDGRYQWLAPYTISGTLGTYRNKYRAINFGIGYRFK